MPQLMKGSLEYSLFDTQGQRKYLNIDERIRFYQVIEKLDHEQMLFCQLLYWSGVRISEALHLKTEHIDLSEKAIIIKSLKKRSRVHYRQIPMPDLFLSALKLHFDDLNSGIWNFSRSTASRFVKKAMLAANISGSKSCARGLRHSFAVNAITHNIPLTLIQKWMGHASISTTSIYLNVLGAEERNFAKRMW